MLSSTYCTINGYGYERFYECIPIPNADTRTDEQAEYNIDMIIMGNEMMNEPVNPMSCVDIMN
jgi:hypothetical protein